jgi:hypothetical protein
LPLCHLFLFQECPCKKCLTQPSTLNRYDWIRGQTKCHVTTLTHIFNKASLLVTKIIWWIGKAGISRWILYICIVFFLYIYTDTQFSQITVFLFHYITPMITPFPLFFFHFSLFFFIYMCIHSL